MQTRFHMRSTGDRKGLMVEDTSMEALKQIRKNDLRFRGARIKSVLQVYPSMIKLGVVYKLNVIDRLRHGFARPEED